MTAAECVPGMRVRLCEFVGKVVRVKDDRWAQVFFTGRTTEGRFAPEMEGGMTALLCNLEPMPPQKRQVNSSVNQ